MAGLNGIISPNLNLVNNHIEVLIIIKLDNGRGQSSVDFHIAWISVIQSADFLLITYTEHHFLKQSAQEIREHLQPDPLAVFHFLLYTLFKVMDVAGKQNVDCKPLTPNTVSLHQQMHHLCCFPGFPPPTVCLHLRELF